MKKELRPLARKEELVVQETGDEVLVYDLVTNKAKCLNETSAYIWRQCDGNRSAREIAREMSRSTKTDVSEEYVLFAFSELSNHGLIESDIHTRDSGISRREVIKKVGLGTMIALPIVASIVAPMAIHAASACNTATPCTCAVTGMSVGVGNPCAPPNTGGCNSFPGCVCMAHDNGNNFSGDC